MGKLVKTGTNRTMALCFMLLFATSAVISIFNSAPAVSMTAASDNAASADDDSGAESTSNWD